MRFGRMMLVWAVASMMATNPASACRGRWRSYCPPASCYYSAPCAPVECVPVEYVPAGCVTVESDCGEGVTTHRPEGPVEEVPSLPPAPTPVPTPAPTPVPAPAEVPPAEPILEEPPVDLPEEAPAAPEIPGDELPAARPDEDPFPAEPAEEMPADEPAEEMPADEEKPADDLEKLFEPGGSAAKESELEDLFTEPKSDAAPEAETADRGQPAQAPPSEAQLAAEADKLFAPPAQTVREPETNGMRFWTDNTGKFRVRARLVEIRPTEVRLFKENGRFTTVPRNRLSGDDLAFVRQQAETGLVANN